MNKAPSAPILNCPAWKGIAIARPQNIIGEAVSIKFPNLLLERKGPKNNDLKENPGSLLIIYMVQTLIVIPTNMAIATLIR